MQMNTTTNHSSIQLKVSQIDIEGSISTRKHKQPNDATVIRYADDLQRGDRFPPIDVAGPDSRGMYYLADGRHRLDAHKMAGRDTIQATIIGQEGWKSALEKAFGRNAKHGRPRSSEDLQHEISLAMMHFSSWSDQMIADAVRCHVNTVRNYRRSLQGSYDVTPQSRIVTGKDGKTYTLPPVPARPPKGSHGVTPAAETIPGLPASFTPGSGRSLIIWHDNSDLVFDIVNHRSGGMLIGLWAGETICTNPIPYAGAFVPVVMAGMISDAHPELVTMAPVITKNGPHEFPAITGLGWRHIIYDDPKEHTVPPLSCINQIQDWMNRHFELELSRADLEAAMVEWQTS